MDIKPYTKNAKKHPKKQIEQVANSIKEFGMNQPLVVDKQGVIIVGHGRYEALKHLGMEITDDMIRVADLTEKQANAYRLADNKLNESEWDMPLVIEELKTLEELAPLTGFDMDLLIEADEADDVVPDVPETPQSVLGDLYELGEHRVLCGDSTKIDDVEKLMDGKKADMVFTDPPYGISFEDSKGNSIKNDDFNDEKLADFNRLWQESANVASKGDCFLLTWQSPRKFHLLEYFGAWKFFRLITMYKSNRISFPHGAWINKTEPCCVFAKGQPRITKQEYMDDCYVYKHDKESHEDSNVGHPTPKPVKMVMSNIKACAKKDDLILDIFLGSGSTLIAAEKTGRICFGMELDPKYIDVIVQRYVDYTGNAKIKKNGTEMIWKQKETI
jgi:site-specific DNA-methyltransferase (adenine-specific)